MSIRNSPPTLTDVAREAGVAPMTASRVFGTHGPVATATRERVLAAARRLGYRPNHLARSLARARTHTLGFVLATLQNPFFAELTDALYRAAGERGYELLIALDDTSVEKEAQHLERFMERRVDGILVWGGMARSAYPDGRGLDAQRTPYVVIGKGVEDDVTSFIDVDRPAGMERAVEHLVRLGRTRIGYLSYDAVATTPLGGASKYAGFLAAMQRRGLVPAICLHTPLSTRRVAETRTVGYEGGLRLAGMAELPEAIVCGGDLLAIGVLMALADRGIRVPEDVAVVGYDGLAEGAFVRPRLTTIEHPMRELAEQGIAAVMELMKAPDASPRRVTLTPQLIVRESCGELRQAGAG
jgi:DNA-binding LacI/PurR family transcriptional regulator